MELLQSWLKEWSATTDANERGRLIQSIPPSLKDEDDIRDISKLWAVRYFYVDKRKTRVGDRFVGLYLAMNIPKNDRRYAKELQGVYNNLLATDGMTYLLESSPDSVAKGLYEAALLYVSTLGELRPLLGLIPVGSSKNNDRPRRVAEELINNHLYNFWSFCRDSDYFGLVSKEFFAAALASFEGIEYKIRDVIVVNKDKDFASWAMGFIEI